MLQNEKAGGSGIYQSLCIVREVRIIITFCDDLYLFLFNFKGDDGMKMQMKSRVVAILRELLMSEEGVAKKSIYLRYNITDRLLYYDLKEINTWLTENEFGEVVISNQSLYLMTAKGKDEIKKELEKRLYYFSRVERTVFEIFIIALSSGPVYLRSFQDYFDVCKSAVVADLHRVRESLEGERMSLLFQLRQGYSIEGDELAIRKKLEIYLDMLNPYLINVFDDLKIIMQHSLVSLTGNDIDHFECARELVRQYKIDIKFQMDTFSEEYACFLIVISWIRSSKGDVISVKENSKIALHTAKSYRLVTKYIRNLKAYGLHIPDEEICYITALLVAIQKQKIVKNDETQSSDHLYKKKNILL